MACVAARQQICQQIEHFVLIERLQKIHRHDRAPLVLVADDFARHHRGFGQIVEIETTGQLSQIEPGRSAVSGKAMVGDAASGREQLLPSIQKRESYTPSFFFWNHTQRKGTDDGLLARSVSSFMTNL